jgi:hypothetical protein
MMHGLCLRVLFETCLLRDYEKACKTLALRLCHLQDYKACLRLVYDPFSDAREVAANLFVFFTVCRQVKNHIMVFINALIENPSFDSQVTSSFRPHTLGA